MSMASSVQPVIADHYLNAIQSLLAQDKRILLGLVGPPGTGKSTLAAALQAQFSDCAQVLPMDGFHLAQVELERLGRTHRKGAPDTFDAAGFVALLHRLRAQSQSETIYAPAFRRDLEEPIAGAIAVAPSTRLLITEGNYLLLQQGAWAEVAALLDEVWYVETDDGLRNQRLLERHMRFGRSQEQAAAWVAQTDQPNALVIAAERARAQRIFRWDASD